MKKTEISLFGAGFTISLVALFFLVTGQTLAIDWTGEDGLWTNKRGWGKVSLSPGQASDTNEVVRIVNDATVTVNADISQGRVATIQVVLTSMLKVEQGAILPSASLLVDPHKASGDGSTFEMNGGYWANQEVITIGRWVDPDGPVNATSTFRMNGGVYTNNNATSRGRVDLGHGDNQGLALVEFNGGDFWNAGPINLTGGGNGRSLLHITGGRFYAGAILAGAHDDSDGFRAEVRVTGSRATSIVTDRCEFYRNEANVNGSSLVKFVPDRSGVTPIRTTLLNLGEGAARGELEVDLSGYSNVAGGAIVLFSYETLTGSFGATNVVAGSQGRNWIVDYRYKGNSIALIRR
ncbi:MAG: hypothetical protein ACO398_04805 [Kiritimatiellia bacterium]